MAEAIQNKPLVLPPKTAPLPKQDAALPVNKEPAAEPAKIAAAKDVAVTPTGEKAAAPSAAAKERATKATEAAMKAYDGNGDGNIDDAELTKWIGEKGGNKEKTTDYTNTEKNAAGKTDMVLSKAEIQDAYERQYGAEEGKTKEAIEAAKTPEALEKAATEKGAADAKNAMTGTDVDKNGDKSLDADEVKAWAKGDEAEAKKLMDANDKNADGKLSEGEVAGAYKDAQLRETAGAQAAETAKEMKALDAQSMAREVEIDAKALATNPDTARADAAAAKAADPLLQANQQKMSEKLEALGKYDALKKGATYEAPAAGSAAELVQKSEREGLGAAEKALADHSHANKDKDQELSEQEVKDWVGTKDAAHYMRTGDTNKDQKLDKGELTELYKNYKIQRGAKERVEGLNTEWKAAKAQIDADPASGPGLEAAIKRNDENYYAIKAAAKKAEGVVGPLPK